jgi:glycosyltransferase involved in cell wall biosynthesis
MKIWLVQTGEEMPIDGPQTRLLRTALLAQELVGRGHEVTYFNATFNHQKKVQRFEQTTKVDLEDGYTAIFLKGRSYTKNVSLSRILSQKENAAAFEALVPNLPKPDVILCGFPTIELAYSVSKYAKQHSIPFIIDARDMWPEVIKKHLEGWWGMMLSPLLGHWRKTRNAAFATATSIVGVSQQFVAWGCACAGRSISNADKEFRLAADVTVHDASALQSAQLFWDQKLGHANSKRKIIMMAGNLSARVDIMTAIKAAESFAQSDEEAPMLVVCGKGDLEAEIAAIAQDCPTLFFVGWRSAAELKILGERSVAGILAYSNVPDLMASFPNKIGEYLSYGLPVITCLKGETHRLLGQEKVLIPYVEGDIASAANAMRLASDQPGKAWQMQASSAYERFFDSQSIYAAFADHIENIVTKKHLGTSQ